MSLHGNKLSGTVPDLSYLTALAILYVQNNSFAAVHGGICAIQDHLTIACDLSDNEIPGLCNAPGVECQKACPVCLNNGLCDQNFPSKGYDYLPIFPNKVCTTPFCACFAPDPTPAPTSAPSTSTGTMRWWEAFKTAMCFGLDAATAPPGCFDITFTLLLAVVFATIVGVLYNTVVILLRARCESRAHGTKYGEAVREAFENRCCLCRRSAIVTHGREEAVSSVQLGASSPLEAPLLGSQGRVTLTSSMRSSSASGDSLASAGR